LNWAQATASTPTSAARRFPAFHPWDRNFLLLYVLLIWSGIAIGKPIALGLIGR